MAVITEGPTPFHAGEIDVQRRAGVEDKMAVIGRNFIRDHMPDQHRDFYESLPFMVLGTQDASGQPWATILAGGVGFVDSPDETHLTLTTALPAADPALAALHKSAPVGGLGIELDTRRRNRFTAHVARQTRTSLELKIDHSFGNCPQFIQTRQLVETRDPATPHAESLTTFTRLDGTIRTLIEDADTFFIASATERKDLTDASSGVDVSHRGGAAGFIKVEDDRTLLVPDYAGNNFFNTLGNLLVNPRAGLLFPDFETGGLVHLAGTVDIVWEGGDVAQLPGAQRAWRFTLDHGIVRYEALPMRFEFGEFSPRSLKTGTWKNPIA